MKGATPIGMRLLALFFAFGACMCALTIGLLLFPGGALDSLWQLNPEAHAAFQRMDGLSILLMSAVGVACALAAIGLARNARSGRWLARPLNALSIPVVTVKDLPEDQKDQVKSAMRAAWRLDAKGGMARMKKLAEWLERDYPSAAASLTEGLEECFTINRLDVPPSLHRCLATTNVMSSYTFWAPI